MALGGGLEEHPHPLLSFFIHSAWDALDLPLHQPVPPPYQEGTWDAYLGERHKSLFQNHLKHWSDSRTYEDFPPHPHLTWQVPVLSSHIKASCNSEGLRGKGEHDEQLYRDKNSFLSHWFAFSLWS